MTRRLGPSTWLFLVPLAAIALYFGPGRGAAPSVVQASSGGSFDPSVALENTNSGSTGGMAQYGTAEQVSTSLSATQQAVNNWNGYIGSRADWYFSSSDVTTIADADWNARQAGSPTITASQMASAANQLIVNTLATMSASNQESLFNQYAYVSSPNGGDPPEQQCRGEFLHKLAGPERFGDAELQRYLDRDGKCQRVFLPQIVLSAVRPWDGELRFQFLPG